MQRGPSIGARPSAVARPGRLRALAPLVVLLVPAAVLLASWLVWSRWPCGTSVCAGPMTVVWGLALLAVPTAVLVGLPWTTSTATIAIAALSSAAMWMCLGRWAAVRATIDVDARWRNVWLELLGLLIGVWGGLIVGLAVLGLVLIR